MSEANVERARLAQATHEAELLRRANVIGVAVGLLQRGGEFTDEIGLVALVRWKLPLEQLAPADRIPRELGGVRVDVQEIGEPRAQEQA